MYLQIRGFGCSSGPRKSANVNLVLHLRFQTMWLLPLTTTETIPEISVDFEVNIERPYNDINIIKTWLSGDGHRPSALAPTYVKYLGIQTHGRLRPKKDTRRFAFAVLHLPF